MSVTSFESEYISESLSKNADEHLPFRLKEIINFIIMEVQMFKFETRLNDSNKTPISAINMQIVALVGITVIYMLIMNAIVYFDK